MERAPKAVGKKPLCCRHSTLVQGLPRTSVARTACAWPLAPPPTPSTGPQGTICAHVSHWGLCQSSLVGSPQMPGCRCRPRPHSHSHPPDRCDCPGPRCSRPCRICHEAAATAANLCVLCSTLCPLHCSLPSQTPPPAASPGSKDFTACARVMDQVVAYVFSRALPAFPGGSSAEGEGCPEEPEPCRLECGWEYLLFSHTRTLQRCAVLQGGRPRRWRLPPSRAGGCADARVACTGIAIGSVVLPAGRRRGRGCN